MRVVVQFTCISTWRSFAVATCLTDYGSRWNDLLLINDLKTEILTFKNKNLTNFAHKKQNFDLKNQNIDKFRP